MTNISKLCYCLSNPAKIIIEDIDVILGKDIISINKASHDLITEKAGYDIFEKIQHKSSLIHINAGA